MSLKIDKLAAGLALSAVAATTAAMPPKFITREERALLPPYCEYTQGGHVGFENPQYPTAKAKYWVGVFGGQGISANFWKMHHYCYALIHIMRGGRKGLTATEYRSAWMEAVGEIDFTLERVSANFILLPEMMLNRGRALVKLKRYDAALQSFDQAIAAKPDYWPPYAEIAEVHLQQRNKDKAIAILRDGLAKSPGTKALERRLSEIGGRGAAPSGSTAAPPRAEPAPVIAQ